MLTELELALIAALIIIGIFCLIIAMLWKALRSFFHNNYSYFDFIFIIAYFVEQLVLIALLVLEPQRTTFWVSIFALLVITTASIQKLSMDSKDKKIRELNIILKYSSDRKSEIIGNYESKIKELSEYIGKLEEIV
jgi:hypothetical protein